MAERKWTKEQQACIDDRGGTLLVSASAGSGKTAVLVQRILEKITDPVHRVDVDRLLVVTFTKAAAAEMKQRISAALGERIAAQPENTRLLQQQLLLPYASISTIDSFCSSLVRENAYLLNIDPQFTLLDEQQKKVLQSEVLQETLSEQYARNDADFQVLCRMLSNGKNDKMLTDTVLRLFTFIQAHPLPEEWLTRMEEVYDDSLPLEQTVWGQLLIQQLRQSAQACLQLTVAAATLCLQDEVLRDKYLPSLEKDQEQFTVFLEKTRQSLPWDALMALVLGISQSTVGNVSEKENALLRQRVKKLRKKVTDELKTMKEKYVILEKDGKEDLRCSQGPVHALYDTVRCFSRKLLEKKREQNVLDFPDLSHFTYQLLTETDENGCRVRSPFALDLMQQYDEIMVDECQDINETQDAIFSALSRNEQNLFYVGDVKQCIYRFRQAMPELFLQRRNTYAPYAHSPENHERYPATITLGNNFRSRKEVTDTANFLCRQLMVPEVGGLSYTEQEELICSADYYPAQTGYETECLLLNEETAKQAGVSNDVAEANVIARQIKQLHGTLSITTKNGEQRPAEYRDFCILLRYKSGHIYLIRKELERLGIPVQSEADGEFLETPEIRLALSLLRCIDNPSLDVPLTAVLLSPLFGFTTEDLTTLRLHRAGCCLYLSVREGARSCPDAILAERCRRFLSCLDSYRSLSACVTVDTLLRKVYEEWLLPQYMGVRKDGAARRQNLQQFHDICQAFEQNGYRGLSAFIQYIDRVQQQGGNFSACSTLGTGDAVRVMSIHGSKGLEFPVVFLAGLTNPLNTRDETNSVLLHSSLGVGLRLMDADTLNRYRSLPHRSIALAIRNDARAEELRILYVALTRAKEKLFLVLSKSKWAESLSLLSSLSTDTTVLPYTISKFPSISDWLLAALLRHPSATALRSLIEEDTISILPAETACTFTFCDFDTEETAPKTVTDVLPDPVLGEEIRKRMAYRYPHEALTHIPTKVAASEVAHKQLALQNIAHSRPSFMEKQGLTPAQRGTAMHDFMQFADYDRAIADITDEAQRLVQKGFLSSEQAKALDLTKLTAFFGSELYTRMAASPRCLREFHFTHRLSAHDIEPSLPPDTAEFTVTQGMTDCVFEENGCAIVVDYKTDRVRTAQELIDRYRSQLLIYQQALSAALNMPVTECWLYSFELSKAIRVPI